MQLCQDPSPAAWARIAYASIRDTLSVLNYKNKIGSRIHGAYSGATPLSGFCLEATSPLAILFLTLLDRLCLSFVTFVKPGKSLPGRFPSTLVLVIALVFGGDGWIRTTALFRGEIYSLVQSTTLPRLQKWYTIRESNPSYQRERLVS